MNNTTMCSADNPNIPHLYNKSLGDAMISIVIFRFLAGVSLVILSMGALDSLLAGELKPKGDNLYQMLTGDDEEVSRSKWDALYNTKSYVFGKDPSQFLVQIKDKIKIGKVLDIAMGEGRNAVYLAKNGFNVEGVDISINAIKKARKLATDQHTSIKTIVADLSHYQIKPDTYDVIMNIDYLQRDLVPQIKKGLKKSGFIIFENQINTPQDKKEYYLEKGELKELFKEFNILIYQEVDIAGRLVARLLATKP